MELDNITHFAWWNMYNVNWQSRYKTETSRLVDANGVLLPPGRALLNDLDPTMSDCAGYPQGFKDGEEFPVYSFDEFINDHGEMIAEDFKVNC